MRPPKELVELRQWCNWSATNGTKIPHGPNGQPTKSNDPTTFVSFDEAIAASENIGFVFQPGDMFCGVDLDNCLGDLGELKPWALPIVERLADVSFAEISPSGHGVKFVTRAKKPANAGCMKKISEDGERVECYDQRRFWTITNRPFTDGMIGNGQDAIDWLASEYLAKPKRQPATLDFKPAVDAGDKILRASRYLEAIDPAIAGHGGHNVTFRAACAMVVGFDLDPADAFRLLWNEYNPRCEPPWTEKELRHKVDSAAKEPGERGHLLTTPTLSSGGCDVSVLLSGPGANLTRPNPAKVESIDPDLLLPPGLISDIIDYTIATSTYEQPELAFAGALALLATITGRKLTDNLGTRTNVYILGLAPSGGGKEQARMTNKELLAAAGGQSMLGPERIGSSAGVTSAIQDSPAILFQLDEIGRLLSTLKSPNSAPHLFNISTVFMQIYGCSGSFWKGDAYADLKKTPQIDHPHPVIYGTSVAENFWGSLNAENITDGFMGRLMPFESSVGYVEPNRKPGIDLPADLVAKIRYWVDLSPGGDLGQYCPKPLVAKYTDAAAKRFNDHELAIHKKRTAEDQQAAALWSRSAGKAGKLALLFAASRTPIGSNEMSVEIEDVDRAIAISNWLTRNIQEKVFDHVAANDQEDRTKKVLRMLTAKPLSRSELTRKTQWLGKRDRRDIIDTLIESGQVEVTTEMAKNGAIVEKFNRI